jgi:hypothetical protein
LHVILQFAQLKIELAGIPASSKRTHKSQKKDQSPGIETLLAFLEMESVFHTLESGWEYRRF